MPSGRRRSQTRRFDALLDAVQDHREKTHEMQSIAENLKGMVGKLVVSNEESEDPESTLGGSSIKELSWNPSADPRLQKMASPRAAIIAGKKGLQTPRHRGERRNRLVPVLSAKQTEDLLSEPSSEEEDEDEADTSDCSSSRSSASAADPDSFDVSNWQGRVAELLGKLHARDEVEAMESLYQDFSNRQYQRSNDAGQLDDIVGERAEELVEIANSGGALAENLDSATVGLMGRLGAFTDTLRFRLDEIRERRKERKKKRQVVKRQFTWSNMKAYRSPRKEESADTPTPKPTTPNRTKRKTMRGPANMAQDLLRAISQQQTKIADMEADTLIVRKSLEAHQTTVAHVEACKGEGARVSMVPESAKEVLQQAVTRWILRSRSDYEEAMAAALNEATKEEATAGLMRSLEEEVELLRLRARELEDDIAAMGSPASTGSGRFLRSPGSPGRRRRGAFLQVGQQEIARSTSGQGPRAASREGDASEVRASNSLRSEGKSGRSLVSDEVFTQVRVEQAQKELAHLEAKMPALEEERNTFMGSLSRSHRVWRQANVASSAGLGAAMVATLFADPEAAGGSRHASKESAGHDAANAPSRSSSKQRKLSPEEELLEMQEAQEANAQQTEWLARQTRLASASGGSAPSSLAEGKEVLARQKQEILDLENALREAMTNRSVRRVQVADVVSPQSAASQGSSSPKAEPQSSELPAAEGEPGEPQPDALREHSHADDAGELAAGSRHGEPSLPASAAGEGGRSLEGQAEPGAAAGDDPVLAGSGQHSALEALGDEVSAQLSNASNHSGLGGDGVSRELSERLEEARRVSRKLTKDLKRLELVDGKDRLTPEEAEQLVSALRQPSPEELSRLEALDAEVEETKQQVRALQDEVQRRAQEGAKAKRAHFHEDGEDGEAGSGHQDLVDPQGGGGGGDRKASKAQVRSLPTAMAVPKVDMFLASLSADTVTKVPSSSSTHHGRASIARAAAASPPQQPSMPGFFQRARTGLGPAPVVERMRKARSLRRPRTLQLQDLSGPAALAISGEQSQHHQHEHPRQISRMPTMPTEVFTKVRNSLLQRDGQGPDAKRVSF